MVTQNSYPKPFVGDSYQSEYNVQRVPKIMVNNQKLNSHQSYQISDGPTSTVHKSMVGSRLYAGEFQQQSQLQHQQPSPAYSRLISPTISQGSLSPQAGQAEFVQHKNQQRNQEPVCGRVSWSSGATSCVAKDAYYAPKHQNQQVQHAKHVQTQQQHHHHQQHQQQHQQHQFQDSTPDERVIDGPAINKPQDDYKDMLARISPSSARNVLLPDDKLDGYMHDKQLERLSIAHQTYRTTPIVSPKPKARHDLAKGSYMHLNQDPTWDMLERGYSSLNSQQSEQAMKFQQALSATAYSRPMKLTKTNMDMLNSLPKTPATQSSNASSMADSNNITGFVGIRAPKLANVQPYYHPGSGSSSQRDSGQDSVPVFDYRQYIESTRHAR